MPIGDTGKFLVYFGDSTEPVRFDAIKEFTPPKDEATKNNIFMNMKSIEMTFKPFFISRKLHNLLAYGWKAKGPCRKRLIMKLKLQLPWEGYLQ